MTCPKLPVMGRFCEGSWNATWDVRPARWLHRRHSAWLLFGVCACFSSLNPEHSEAQTAGVVAVIDENSDNNALDDAISAADQASHGKKVYTDYSVTDMLQTGMRGAFGKPQGTCAHVAIGQVLLSVRCKDNHSNHAQEALRRAKFKFPGRQKIIVSRKWGFTKFTRADYLKWKSESRIVPDGVNAKLLGCRGPLSKRKPGQAFLKPALVSSSDLVA